MMIIDNPLISVIIPVYNGSNYLQEAIESVLHQTYKNYEIIIIDDGSTDNTWDIIGSYGDLIRGFHKENGGVASALNYGIQVMKGDWFAWLSHDDLWVPEKLEVQISYHIKNENVMGSFTNFSVIDEKGTLLFNSNCPYVMNSCSLRELFLTNYIAGDTVLLHKKILKDIGRFNENLRVTQDYDMWLRILQKYDLGVIQGTFTKIRYHPNQDGRKSSQYLDGELRQLLIYNFEKYDKKRLFADTSYVNKKKIVSIANYWFADTVCYYRQWADIADSYYSKSMKMTPNVKLMMIYILKGNRWFKVRKNLENSKIVIYIQKIISQLSHMIFYQHIIYE